jgi:hypothetical protein
LPVVLSVPHLVQRMALPGKPSDWPFLYHPVPGRGSGPADSNSTVASSLYGSVQRALRKFAGAWDVGISSDGRASNRRVRRGRCPLGIAPEGRLGLQRLVRLLSSH